MPTITPPKGCAFTRIQSHASEAVSPTPAQAQARNYKLGRTNVHGFKIAIENPRGSTRSGVSPDGKAWSNRMAAHYGEFSGTRGADGDAVDVFVGDFPESTLSWVINQKDAKGGFDEHKAMLGFQTEQQARDAYRFSFDRDWRGMGTIVPITLSQLKWWLRHGDMKRPLTADQLPYPEEGKPTMDRVLWNPDATPAYTTLAKALYDIRAHDGGDGLVFDAVTMDDIMSDPDITGRIELDALVVETGRMQQKMDQVLRVMKAAASTVQPVDLAISDPVKARGVMQIAVLFNMDDGQTITVWFHNPDTTPAKLTPMDELISWKWMLNKKDVTIVVAPEFGRDLNVREVARRIMKLVEKNSEGFKRANGKAAERAAMIEGLKTEITGLQTELVDLDAKIAAAKAQAATIPEAVKTAIKFQVARLQDVAFKLDGTIKARGRGQYLALELRDQQGAITDATAKLSEIRALAEGNGLAEAFDKIVADLGGVPDFASYGEPAADPVPAIDNRTPMEKWAAELAPILTGQGFDAYGQARHKIAVDNGLNANEELDLGRLVEGLVGPAFMELARAKFDPFNAGLKAAIRGDSPIPPDGLDEAQRAEWLKGFDSNDDEPAKAVPTQSFREATDEALSLLAISEKDTGVTTAFKTAQRIEKDAIAGGLAVAWRVVEDAPAEVLDAALFPEIGAGGVLTGKLDGGTDVGYLGDVYIRGDGQAMFVLNRSNDHVDNDLSDKYGTASEFNGKWDGDVSLAMEWLASTVDMFGPQGEDPEASGELIYNGIRLYRTTVKMVNGASEMWAVETPENKARRESGERILGGDSLHDTLEQAKKAADIQAMNEASKKEFDAQELAKQKEREAAAAARAEATKGMSLAQIKAMDHMNSLIKDGDNGDVITRAEWIKRRVEAGARPTVEMTNKVKPMTRAQFNRASNEEQRAHEKKVAAGGKIPQYWLGNASVNKTEYDYAVKLVAELPEPELPNLIKQVDDAYAFEQASDRFKEYIADTVAEAEYSMFATAKAMDEEAKAQGAIIAWDVEEVGMLDSVGLDNGADEFLGTLVGAEEGDEEGAEEVDEEVDGDAEFDACPVVDEDDGAVMDGDFRGHPFRGNQYKKASKQSHAAVSASISAKRAEKDGDHKAAKSAHKSAHYSHMAAMEGAKGSARRYHKTMAKFHGSRAGVTLDSVDLGDEVLDKVEKVGKLSIVGRIYKDGLAAGAATISGDGKAMVYVKGLGGDRVMGPDGMAANRADDPSAMIKWLLKPAAPASATSPFDAFMDSGKEEWQVTQSEWVAVMTAEFKHLGTPANDSDVSDFKDRHKSAVKAALDDGRPVSAEVLADYPGMKAESAKEKDIRIAESELRLKAALGIKAPGREEWDKTNATMQAEVNNQVSEPVQEQTPVEINDIVYLNYIKISADSIEELRKVDVLRVLESVKADNSDGVTRQGLAGWISAKRPDLAQEVAEVMAEEFGATTSTASVEPSKEADAAYIQTIINGSADLLDPGLYDKLEPLFAKYEADPEMMALLTAAADVYGKAVEAAAMGALGR